MAASVDAVTLGIDAVSVLVGATHCGIMLIGAVAIAARVDFTLDALIVASRAGCQAIGRTGLPGVAGQAGLVVVAVDAARGAGGLFVRHASVEACSARSEAIVGAGLLGARIAGGVGR